MKKWVPGLLIFFAFALVFVYMLLPGRINFSEERVIHGNTTNATRFISDQRNWGKWWPAQAKSRNENPDSFFSYHSYRYVTNWKLLTGDSIRIENNPTIINSLLNIIPLGGDSVKIQWNGQSVESLNPLQRIQNYSEQGIVRKNILDILESMTLFLENKDALYGLHIDQIMVKDTLLIARKLKSGSYPATNEIYNAIAELKAYISKNDATETHFPMLHISKETGIYETMIAIPISKPIPANSKFVLKRMIPGKILITEVKGGPFSADIALKRIENYMEDYQLLSPAIPFQSLVTDRSKETDTSKWITVVYYPVM